MPLISGEPDLRYVCHVRKETLPTIASGKETTSACGNIELDWSERQLAVYDMAQIGLQQT